jgi:hypothetical protein
VIPRPFPLPKRSAKSGSDWQATLPPHSLVVFTLKS